jgi:PAS domain S-box-containing protein
VAVATDISERKRADALLAESEERYRRLVEDSPQPVAVHADGRLVYLNRAALALLGAESAQDVIGRSIFDFLHADFHRIAAERILKMEHVGDPAAPIVETLLRVDGSPVDVKLAATPIVWRGKPAIELSGHVLGSSVAESGRERATVVDFSTLLLDLAPRIEDRIAPRAAVTLDLCEARVALREASAPLEELICALVAQASAALPRGRGALLLRSELRELAARELAAFVPGPVGPGRYLVFEACAQAGGLDGKSRERLFDAGFAKRFPGRGPGLATALGIARALGGALRVHAGAGEGLRIALALPAAGGRRAGSSAVGRRRSR